MELPAVMATMTASEASLETQYRAALDDMGSANEMAVWMLENGPVASVLAIRNCRTQTMVASALMSLPGEPRTGARVALRDGLASLLSKDHKLRLRHLLRYFANHYC